MRQLDLSVRFEAPTDTGLIRGHAAIWDERNGHNEVLKRGAFAMSLRRHKIRNTRPLMLWAHDQSEPIGVWDSVTEDERGLAVSGKIVTETRRGQEALALLKAGALDGLSIGFIIREQSRKKKTRILKQIDLKEISLVALPSAPGARIESVRTEIGRMNPSAAALVLACRKASRSLTKGKRP